MAKGIPAPYEAKIYTKAGTICSGSTVGTYTGLVDVVSSQAVIRPTDTVNPAVLSLYNPHASLALLVNIGTSYDDQSADIQGTIMMSIPAKATQKIILGSGWYLFAYYNDATGGTFSVTSQGATIVQG